LLNMDRIQSVLSKLNSRAVNPMRGIHWIAKGILRGQGFKWEIRRNGDLKMGYWRKSLRTKNQKSAYPKRFVLIPGFGDTPLSWHAVVILLLPVLKRQYDEVILFDFPGFGGFLSKERAFPTVEMMMTSVADALDALKPHTLCGHSLGGWLAAYYAGVCGQGKRPASNRLNYSGPTSLLLINPSGIYPDEPTMRQCEAIIKGSLGMMGNEKDPPNERFSILRPHLFSKEPKWFSLISGHFKHFLGREDIVQFVGSAKEDLYTLNDTAKNIQAKTWVLWGENDTLIPVSCAESWLTCMNSENAPENVPENVPKNVKEDKPQRKTESRAVILKKTGHSPHLEAPVATSIVLGQILTGITPHRVGRRWWTVMQSSVS